MPYKIRPQKNKEAAAPVQIVTKSERLFVWISNHPQWVWGGIALVILLGVMTFTVQYFNQQAEEAAWAIESEASKLLNEPPPLPKPISEEEEDAPIEIILSETERLEKAAGLYEKILTEHADSNAAVVALYESGNAYEKLGQNDKAETRFLAFIEKYPNERSLSVLSKMKLAYLYQKKGDVSGAINLFREIYESPDVEIQDQAGFELARALESQGKHDEAKALFEALSTQYIESPWGIEAKARFVLLSPSESTTETDEAKEETSENTDADVSEEKTEPLPEEISD